MNSLKKKILVIAPHPDDETLGCGGSMLKWKQEGHEVYWLIVTKMSSQSGFDNKQISIREEEIKQVSRFYEFDGVFQLSFSPASLTESDFPSLISDIGGIVRQHNISSLVLPYPHDAHSDHKIVFDAAAACSKVFRYPSINEVLVYETLSETGFGLSVDNTAFNPNYYVDITEYLDKKIEAMYFFKSEILPHPFPRSEESLRALSTLRGSVAGCKYAESFMMLKMLT